MNYRESYVVDEEEPQITDVVCRQRTEMVDRWTVSTIECDPDLLRFASRDRLEVTYVTDGTGWLAVGRVAAPDDAARWAGRPLRGGEVEQVRAHAARGLVAGPPPWTPPSTADGCVEESRERGEDEAGEGHASSSDGRWCPLPGGGVRRGHTDFMSESGYHNGRYSVELISITPLR